MLGSSFFNEKHKCIQRNESLQTFWVSMPSTCLWNAFSSSLQRMLKWPSRDSPQKQHIIWRDRHWNTAKIPAFPSCTWELSKKSKRSAAAKKSWTPPAKKFPVARKEQLLHWNTLIAVPLHHYVFDAFSYGKIGLSRTHSENLWLDTNRTTNLLRNVSDLNSSKNPLMCSCFQSLHIDVRIIDTIKIWNIGVRNWKKTEKSRIGDGLCTALKQIK